MTQNDIFNYDFGQLSCLGLSARSFACLLCMVRVYSESIVEKTTGNAVVEAVKEWVKVFTEETLPKCC